MVANQRNCSKACAKIAFRNYQRDRWQRMRTPTRQGRNMAALLAVRKNAPEIRTILDREWERLLVRYDHRCGWCRRRLTTSGLTALEWDHIVPVSRGGRHAIGNLIPACRACNRGRGSCLAIEWKRYLAST